MIEFHKLKKVNFLAGLKDNDFSKEREDIYRKVMEENGLTVTEKNIYYGGFWEVPAEAAMKQIYNEMFNE